MQVRPPWEIQEFSDNPQKAKMYGGATSCAVCAIMGVLLAHASQYHYQYQLSKETFLAIQTSGGALGCQVTKKNSNCSNTMVGQIRFEYEEIRNTIVCLVFLQIYDTTNTKICNLHKNAFKHHSTSPQNIPFDQKRNLNFVFFVFFSHHVDHSCLLNEMYFLLCLRVIHSAIFVLW